MVMDGGGSGSFLRQPMTSVVSRSIVKSVVFFILIMF
jgi:hypothetical protein